MQNFRQPFMGGMPQMGQQGQQGPQMPGPQGPPMGPPQGPPQGAPPPRQGPGQLGPGMGGGQQQPEIPFGMRNMMGAQPGGGIRGELQSTIDHYQRQLMMAQINGAPPQIIASLQMQLQQAQRAMQEAGMRAIYNQQMNRPQPGRSVGQSNSRTGGGGVGGRPSPYYQQQMQDWNAQMQLLMGLYGMGGGPRGVGG